MPEPGYFGEGEIIAPPRRDAEAVAVTAFVICPIGPPSMLLDEQSLQEIYRIAYEQAVAALRPSWYERLLLASGN